MISAYYGKNYSSDTIKEKCNISRDGVSMLGISEAAESIGFRTSGVKISWDQLRDETPLPCIVHWNQTHFVIVYRIRKSKSKSKHKRKSQLRRNGTKEQTSITRKYS